MYSWVPTGSTSREGDLDVATGAPGSGAEKQKLWGRAESGQQL